MAFVGHPILDEIRSGIRLRPTKTNDKSAPVIQAPGERRIQIQERGSCPPAPPPPPMLGPPPQRCASASPLTTSFSSPQLDRGALLEGIRSGVQLRKVQTRDKSAPIIQTQTDGITSSEADNCTQATSQSVRVPAAPPLPPPIADVPPSAPPPPPPPPPSSSNSTLSKELPAPVPKKSADFVFRESDLYVTGDKLQKEIPSGKAAISKAIFEGSEKSSPSNSPPSFVPEHQRKYSLNSYLRPPPKNNSQQPDAAFDEAALKVTSETLRREIPAGNAADKIAKFANNESAGSTNSLPRIRFKPGQIRSPFHESPQSLEVPTSAPAPAVANGGGTLPRAKSPSLAALHRPTPKMLDSERCRPFTPTSNSSPPAPSNSTRSASISAPSFARSLFDQPRKLSEAFQPAAPSKPHPEPPVSARAYQPVYMREYEKATSSINKPTSQAAKSAPTIVPFNPHTRQPLSLPSQKEDPSASWVTVTATPATTTSPPRFRQEPGRIVYNIHNGEPRVLPNSGNAHSATRSRSATRPSWRETPATTTAAATGFTYSNSPSSSNFTYTQPSQTPTSSVTYTPVSFTGSPQRSRAINHIRASSEMPRQILVRTDLLPASPQASVEPSPVSPLRPLEVRDAHTSPISGSSTIAARNPFNSNMRPSIRPSSPESSMSSQQSPSSLSPGSTSPPNNKNSSSGIKGLPEAPMPRPYFGNYRTTTTTATLSLSGSNAREAQAQAEALKQAVLEAAKNKTGQRLIAVPISSPWHNADGSVSTHRVISPQDLCHLNPEAMRGNFCFNIDLGSDAPLSISRR